MQKFVLLCLLLISGFYIQAKPSNDAYNIKIKVDGISNDFAILAYYYSDTKYIHDTITFDANGVGMITNLEPNKTGIYLLAFPTLKLRYFELILGEEKKFSMSTDTTDMIGNMVVKESIENGLFYTNLKFMIDKGTKSNELKEKLKEITEDSDAYQQISKEIETIDKEIISFRKDLIAKAPNTFYASLLVMMQDVELPENPNPADSSFAYHFYQKHYFDNVNLTDARLIRTPPVLINKINRFLDQYTIPTPDSINIAIDKILTQAKPNYDMFQFLLQNIFNKYAKSNIMSHETVYVHIAQKYYADTVLVDWVDEEQRNKILEVVRKKTPTLLGSVAPEIFIKDFEGNNKRLHDVVAKNDYTILAFWNSSCGHCKKDMPQLKEAFLNDLKPLANVAVFAVSTEVEVDEASEFLKSHNLYAENWTNCIDVYGSNPFRVFYDVVSTPLILVLDKDKKILAKRISIEDIKGLIEFDLKNKQKIK
jgi:thiol-disulfide isomerase/thioredoxin